MYNLARTPSNPLYPSISPIQPPRLRKVSSGRSPASPADTSSTPTSAIGMAQAVAKQSKTDWDWDDWGATHQADNLAGMLFLAATQPIFEGRTCQAFDA